MILVIYLLSSRTYKLIVKSLEDSLQTLYFYDFSLENKIILFLTIKLREQLSYKSFNNFINFSLYLILVIMFLKRLVINVETDSVILKTKYININFFLSSLLSCFK